MSDNYLIIVLRSIFWVAPITEKLLENRFDCLEGILNQNEDHLS